MADTGAAAAGDGAALPDFPSPFKEADYGDGLTPRTLLEIAMMQLKQTIIEKPDWETKINDPSIVARWREESREHISDDRAFKYIIDELKAVAASGEAVIETGVDGVFCSKRLISEGIRQQLIALSEPLAQTARAQGLWHPGSEEKVLDLVHPSLYCFVSGYTATAIAKLPPTTAVDQSRKRAKLAHARGGAEYAAPAEAEAKKVGEEVALAHKVAKDTVDSMKPQTWRGILAAFEQELEGEGKKKSSEQFTAPESGGMNMADYLASIDVASGYDSPNFQWLPAEFAVDGEGHVRIESYINNLHPDKHGPLYECLAGIFENAFLPLFERVLGGAVNPKPLRIDVDPYNWYGAFEGDSEDYDAYDNWHEHREPAPPTVTDFEALPEAHTVSLKGRQLQVIVKLANIELTPAKPRYNGGTWHVEGTTEEAIVSSGIYYLESTNISNSRLAFRAGVREPDYEQSDDNGVRAIYGLENEAALNQVFGSIATTEGLCIAFPNIMQHCVRPFELTDPSQPGFRKILVFFLVDPNRSINSTANILPQQREWYEEALQEGVVPGTGKLAAMLRERPAWPMTRADALLAQDALMNERAQIVQVNNEKVFEREFSLCEH